MTRGIRVAVTLLAVSLLVRPFDCLAAGGANRKTADCCSKRKCLPTPGSDECCRTIVPGGDHLITSKISNHSAAPIFGVSPIDAPSVVPQPPAASPVVEAHRPPGSPPGLLVNLPLLI